MATDAIPCIEIEVGRALRVVRITAKDARLARQLAAFGIAPGVEVVLLARWPSYVLRCDQTEIALEERLARLILVESLHVRTSA